MILSIATDYHVTDAVSRAEQARRMAAAGFRGVHWCWDWCEYVLYGEPGFEKARQELAAGGLRLIDTHGSEDKTARCWHEDHEIRDRGLRLHEDRIRFTAALGGDAVTLHPPGKDALEPGLPRFLDAIRALEPLCRETRVGLAVENTGHPELNRRVFSALFEAFDRELVGLTWDTGHGNLARDNDWLMANCLDRPMVLHLNDNRGEKDDHVLPAMGTVDWPKVMAAIRRSPYRKPITLEVGMVKSGYEDEDAFLRAAFEKAVTLAGESATQLGAESRLKIEQ
ncbi:MAG: sugar phosphate isomerase/epimerase [Planctomycetes bacterium]|nr:sugar phosphate isomerase/epimerase [Planctomycetota bacterium]